MQENPTQLRIERFLTVPVYGVTSTGSAYGETSGGPVYDPVYEGSLAGSASVGKSSGVAHSSSGSVVDLKGVGGKGGTKILGAGHGYFPNSKKVSIDNKGGAVKGRYGIMARVYNMVGHASPLAAAGGCPHGYMSYGGSCYLFSREKLSWFHAAVRNILTIYEYQ